MGKAAGQAETAAFPLEDNNNKGGRERERKKKSSELNYITRLMLYIY